MVVTNSGDYVTTRIGIAKCHLIEEYRNIMTS